jgi:hypothetical protein
VRIMEKSAPLAMLKPASLIPNRGAIAHHAREVLARCWPITSVMSVTMSVATPHRENSVPALAIQHQYPVTSNHRTYPSLGENRGIPWSRGSGREVARAIALAKLLSDSPGQLSRKLPSYSPVHLSRKLPSYLPGSSSSVLFELG